MIHACFAESALLFGCWIIRMQYSVGQDVHSVKHETKIKYDDKLFWFRSLFPTFVDVRMRTNCTSNQHGAWTRHVYSVHCTVNTTNVDRRKKNCTNYNKRHSSRFARLMLRNWRMNNDRKDLNETTETNGVGFAVVTTLRGGFCRSCHSPHTQKSINR